MIFYTAFTKHRCCAVRVKTSDMEKKASHKQRADTDWPRTGFIHDQSLGFMNSLFVFFDGWLTVGLCCSMLSWIVDRFLLVENFLATVPTRFSYLQNKEKNKVHFIINFTLST